jgi:hypothetical protein
MLAAKHSHEKEKQERPEYTLGEVLRKYLKDYEKEYGGLTYKQRSVVNNIMKCRTAALGGHILVCKECGHVEISYNACKDRHCPGCGAFEKAQWLEAQKKWLLPVDYYHAVFTIDHVFNPLVWRNKREMYNLLCRTVAKVLKEYGREYLDGEIGFTMVLHTWGQQIQAHPHVHVIITGGALVKTAEGYRWQAAKKTFLFPVKKLSKDFRKAFCEGIRKLLKNKKLDTELGRLDVQAMLEEGESKNWEVYLQPPIAGIENLLDYLGRYVFRIAISNNRIVKVEKGKVTFEYYDNREGGKQKEKTVTAVEFIRRFLLHVLPKRFMRIRHYGLHHGSCRGKLAEARQLLGLAAEIPATIKLKLAEWLQEILGEDAALCPHCGVGKMMKVRAFARRTPQWKLKLATLLGRFYIRGVA